MEQGSLGDDAPEFGLSEQSTKLREGRALSVIA